MQHDFILLDRSGSMLGTMWTESLNAINAYVKKLADDNIDTGITLAVFDSNEPFKIIRDRITPKTWKPVTNADAEPRGGTPLNDATATLINLAKKGTPWGEQYNRVAIVVVTDGEENSSQEFGGGQGTQRIKIMLDEVRAKDWQVIFLGANFDNAAQATARGIPMAAFASTSVNNMGATMRGMAAKRAAYSTTGASMSYNSLEKAALASEKPLTDEELADLANGITTTSSVSSGRAT